MSSLIGTNTAYPAGQITVFPREGVRVLDALSADVISSGALVFNDYANATAGLRGYKLPGVAGAERGPWAVTVRPKVAGVVKLQAVRHGKVTVVAGGTIAGGAYVRPSATTAGAVDQYATATDAPGLCVGQYTKLSKYANSADGNHALAAAVAGDIIEIDLDQRV
jgi:hypothetical protein